MCVLNTQKMDVIAFTPLVAPLQMSFITITLSLVKRYNVVLKKRFNILWGNQNNDNFYSKWQHFISDCINLWGTWANETETWYFIYLFYYFLFHWPMVLSRRPIWCKSGTYGKQRHGQLIFLLILLDTVYFYFWILYMYLHLQW